MPEKSKPRIAIIGAGAIGSLVGGLLAQSGEEVTLIARPAHVAAIRARGLRLEGVLGELTIPVSAAEALDFQPDLVLLGVKTQDVENVCRPLQAYLQTVPLITLQNGVRSDDLVATLAPRANVISGVVLFNAQFLQPGHITYARRGALLIGAAFGPNGPRLRELQARLNRALRTEVSDNIRGAHWTKLLVNNLANGLEAMAGLSISDCFRHPGLRAIGALALKEGYQTMARAGLRLAPLPGIPMALLQFIAQAPLPLAAGGLSVSMGQLKTLSSTLQSLRRGRPTEIDYLNGEIVRLGQQLGVATPYNALVVQTVHEVEQRRQFYTPADLERRFARISSQGGPR